MRPFIQNTNRDLYTQIQILQTFVIILTKDMFLSSFVWYNYCPKDTAYINYIELTWSIYYLTYATHLEPQVSHFNHPVFIENQR